MQSNRCCVQANTGDDGPQQPPGKRRKSRKQEMGHAPEAPVGIPNPINAPFATGAPIFQVSQDHILNVPQESLQQLPAHIMPADPCGLNEAHLAEFPAHDPFAQLSLPALNEILEKRLNQRLVPEFHPHEGKSKTATAKQFQRVRTIAISPVVP